MTSSTHGGCVQIPTLTVVDDTFSSHRVERAAVIARATELSGA